VNYMRNSVKAIVDAYDGTTTFYVFDAEDPIIAAYRGIFPSLFKDASAMPPACASTSDIPKLLLQLQASVYGLYHMTESRRVLQPRGSLERGDGRRLDQLSAARRRRRWSRTSS